MSSDSNVDSEGEFHIVKASIRLSVPPIFANSPRAGIEEMLDSMTMRYIHALRGVVLSHSYLSFTDNRATIKADCPFLVCDVGFNATVWSPRVGMKLVGRVNLCSPDHVSLLIHKTFNASIPRNHIPGDKWEFQYGLPENDPEFGPDAPMEEKRSEQEGAGKWVNRQSGQRLGGELGDLEFTVIGLTVANEMLSIQGSIQLDPFSPKHAMRTDATRQPEETETEADKLEDESEEDGSSDIDTFRSLGRKAVQAATADLQERKLENSRSQAMRKKKQEAQGKDETILPKGKKARK